MIASHNTLFQGLARVIETPSREVVLCDALPETGAGDGSIGMVLMHDDGADRMRERVLACRQRFAHAVIGILVSDMAKDCSVAESLFEQRVVQGILPLTFKLDVWLAAVSLLLSGGDYYPVSRRPASNQVPVDALPPPQHQNTAATSLPLVRATAMASDLPALTAREQQILALLSEGHQNKLIAHKMALSEHTVKVHVHNLLSKLRVTNRTQAAAAYRSRADEARLVASQNQIHSDYGDRRI